MSASVAEVPVHEANGGHGEHGGAPPHRYGGGVSELLSVHAPGRVNLIGDHTDYTGGLVLPMAIDRGTTLTFERRPGVVELTSDASPDPVTFALPFDADPASVLPRWGTYVAAMARELGAVDGVVGRLVSDIPAGAGLSSSAALECAVGLALGFEGSAADLATMARRAEHAATGVPTGIMDQLCIAAATAGHATLIDCQTLAVSQVPVPADIDVVVEFVAHRTLVGSAYADRVAECALAEADIGPLRSATPADVVSVTDAVARRRARHVVSENQRVRDAVDALAAGDVAEVGRLMTESHRSLRDDFDTSTDQMDAAVEQLLATPGVYGARMTGGGFGGCVVAVCRPGAVERGWTVSASPGVRYV
jgi:galactokinase